MMPGDVSKSVKKELCDLVYAAHEKALRDGLEKLGKHFERWQRGEIDAIAIADRIREFDEGPSRAVYRRFTWSRNDELARLVADAIRSGLLAETELSPKAVAAVSRWLSFFRRMDDEETEGAANEP